MNKKILISEREKSHIGSLYNLINEKKEIESKPPFNATLVDIVVSDRANDPIADAKVKFFYNGKRILYDKTYRTDSNGIIQNIPVLVEKESIAIVLPYEKNKDKDILKDGKFSACKQNTEIEIEIIVDGEKYKNKHKICLNNGYELDGVYSRYDNVLDSNKLKIKVPIGIEEAQPFTLEWCVKLTNKHYQDMLNVDSSEVTVESLGGNGFISKRSDDVLTCYMKYRKQYPSDMQTTINRLTSTRTNLENFRLKWTLDQRRDIYKENKIMSIYNTIRKVISEHIKKRQIISEDKEVRVIKPQVTNKVKDHDTAVKYYISKNSRLIPHQQTSMGNFTRSSRSDGTLWVEDPYVEGKKYYIYQNKDFDYARDKDNANTGLFLWNDNGKARPVKQLADIIFKDPITIPVVKEHIEKKQIILEEKKLINKRYKFSLVGINKNRRRIVESILRDERRMLLRAGYNKTIVNETFLDVMNGLYGAEGNNVLKDIKTRLGQKIADQVKNKEDEHNMIVTAFEALPEEVIERAIKENRVDELSAMIATKAMEGYKTSFGTEGISGLMFASVDENKFKQEVAKLIEPAIKDITTKMDEKFKQVQDVVSGIGLNPAA